MQVRPLSPRPNLEQYKKQAKDLLQACKSADADAIRDWAEWWFDAFANEWVETEARLRGVAATQEFVQATKREEIRCMEKKIRASELAKPDASLADAQLFIAREHGYESWPKFVKQIQALRAGNSLEANFEAAASAVVCGDIRTLKELLRQNPELVRMRSQRTHRATLLHYVAANGFEDFRQKTPANIIEIATLLLDAGADVNTECNAYGGSTTLGLVSTSVHPERAGVQEDLLQVLLDRGAVIDKPAVEIDHRTAVAACLVNGRGKAARFLAFRGARLNLETAAGAGRLDIVRSLFQENGTPKPTASQMQIQRGFLWACRYGHQDVAEFLLEHGADLADQDALGATGLHWAAGGGHLGIVRFLIGRGAPLEERNQWDGTVLEHVGWSFVNGDPAIDYLPVLEEVLTAGAKLQDGWLAWLDRQTARPHDVKVRLADLLRRYGATS